MDHIDFVRLVAEMRTAQREFFRTRSTAALDRSRSLERRVDEALRRELDGQGTLFEED